MILYLYFTQSVDTAKVRLTIRHQSIGVCFVEINNAAVYFVSSSSGGNGSNKYASSATGQDRNLVAEAKSNGDPPGRRSAGHAAMYGRRRLPSAAAPTAHRRPGGTGVAGNDHVDGVVGGAAGRRRARPARRDGD